MNSIPGANLRQRADEIFLSAQMYATAAVRLNVTADTLTPSIVLAALTAR
jgi:hypothetical protein